LFKDKIVNAADITFIYSIDNIISIVVG